MKIPEHFSDELPFEEQLLYVLSVLKKGSANEIAIELMELKGISSEEGVADLTVHTERELEKLQIAKKVSVLKERHEKKRYVIGEFGDR